MTELTRKYLESLIPKLLDDEKGEIPCMSTTLRRLSGLNADADGAMRELSEIILEDYGLINKVLQVVNSSYYRRLNREVTTVTQAVILLGFNTIKSIAMDMAILDLLAEHDSREAASVMAQAFLSANLAQAVDEQTGGKTPEAIFVASLYRPMARMVTSLQAPEIYARLVTMEQHGDSSEKKVVRHFFRGMGYKLAEKWSIPPRLAGFMEGCRQFADSVPQRELGLVRASSGLTKLLFSAHDQQEVAKIISTFESDLDVERDQLIQCLERAYSLTRDKSPALSHLFQSINFTKLLTVQPEPEEAGADQASEQEKERTSREDDKEELFLDLLNQITQAILENKLTVDQVLLLAVEVIRRGLDPLNVALCLFTPDRKRLVVKYALGEQAGTIKKHFHGRDPMNQPPLKAAFQEDSEVMGTWSHLLDRDQPLENQAILSNPLCASPIRIRDRALGCFLVDFSPSRDLNGKVLKKIAQVRRLVVLSAMQRVQGG